jgi:hypothetical protein
MMTTRLTKADKDSIFEQVESLLDRLERVPTFPHSLAPDDLIQLFDSAADPDVVAHVRALERLGEAQLLKTSGVWAMTIGPATSAGGVPHYPTYYKLMFYGLPNRAVLRCRVVPAHAMYAPIMEYCYEMTKAEANTRRLLGLTKDAVGSCSTAGQIMRLMPFLEQYLRPGHLRALAGQERVSRMPKLNLEKQGQLEELHTNLAMASLVKPFRDKLAADPTLAYAPRVERISARVPEKSPWLPE